jgi:acyl-CoA synthetase (AMP-forming)/AMP-acid ligase II
VLVLGAFQYPQVAVDTMQRMACTAFAGVPSMYQQLVARSSFLKIEWPRLRHVQQAGGALEPRTILEMRRALNNTRIYVMYGQTEATARLSYLPPDRLEDKIGSVGRGLKNVKLELVTHSGSTAAAEDVGEIVASGPSIALGYLEPETARDRFREGRLYTGDLARRDDDGFLYIVGRESDFLKIAGHRISAVEIERVLLGVPEIDEVAVIGEPDRMLGEVPKAFVTLRPGTSQVSPRQLMAHCREHLPPYAVPRQYVVVDQLPKNDAGKILKQSLF